ncbi:MAG: mannitol dehydrogenase family protein [Alphaproteobacteria bacterium]|nr:mannitol dehydrogenase family protein [Alphaproteobacteria bacterium]
MSALASSSTILHLGLGSFHRAHQALYLHRLIAAGDERWTIAAGNTRPDVPETIAALAAQGGAYVLETVATDGTRRYERVRSLRRVVPHTPDLAGLVGIGADPATRIISFTVTEAGYHLDAEDRLIVDHPALARDVDAARRHAPGPSLYAALTAILRARRAAGAGSVTLLSCDNLRRNGDRSRAGLLQFIAAVGDAPLRDWVAANTTSPNAMVDRITPRPTPEIRSRVRAATGRDDAAPVMAEAFIQWVIEDRFCNGRPAWETVGATLVESVAPYEEAKIRILNASHSAFAWGGAIAGLRFIHEAVARAPLRRLAFDFVTSDVIPCLSPSPLDLADYRDTVLDRFANAAIADTVQRVASDSFSKIPTFVAPTLHDRLARGGPIDGAGALAALFLGFLDRWHRGALGFAHEDQAMVPAVARAICVAPDPVAALCADRGLWGAAAGDARFVDAVHRAVPRVVALFDGAAR